MKTCIIISGPTAVGKTSIAIALAKHFSTEIISADSRQCYKELSIAVAKPSKIELQQVHHYFIDSHSIQEELSAADFEKIALTAIDDIFLKNDIAIMVGGTGLYIKAFCEGLDEIPAIGPGIKASVIAGLNNNGIEWLQKELENKDPDYFATGEMENPQRMMRALEVKLSTGSSIRFFQSKEKKLRNFNIIQIGLELPREILYQRINARVDNMMEMGLMDEAKSLLPYKQLNALQTVGYKELFDHLEGKISLEKAVELIKQNTRHYAKRQLTWFKRDGSITWLAPDTNIVLELLNVNLKI